MIGPLLPAGRGAATVRLRNDRLSYKLKNWRRIATRYDKTPARFIWLRAYEAAAGSGIEIQSLVRKRSQAKCHLSDSIFLLRHYYRQLTHMPLFWKPGPP